MRSALVAASRWLARFLPGALPHDSLSGRAYRSLGGRSLIVRGIDRLFFNETNHCLACFIFECKRRQNLGTPG